MIEYQTDRQWVIRQTEVEIKVDTSIETGQGRQKRGCLN